MTTVSLIWKERAQKAEAELAQVRQQLVELETQRDLARQAREEWKTRAELAEARTQGMWIKCSERMPEYDKDVILWAEKWDRVYLGYWRHSEEWIGRHRAEDADPLPDIDPTHWRELPAPPE